MYIYIYIYIIYIYIYISDNTYNTYTGKINTNKAGIDQTNFLENIIEFNNKSRPKTKEGMDTKFFW